MPRNVKEWVGRNPDSKIPPRVRLRIFERHGGVCHLSGRKIAAGEPWDCDHIIALINGGEHRESNLAPALRDKHRQKTADDVAEKAKVARKAKANLGLKPAPAKPIQSPGFAPKAPKPSTARQPSKLEGLPRRAIYR
jgi:5-methylcytosine-specific restriction endonuclease McrA